MPTVNRSAGAPCTSAVEAVAHGEDGAVSTLVSDSSVVFSDSSVVSTSSVAQADAQLADLKNQLAFGAALHTATSNISSVGHRVGMTVIGNCKA
jgi:hypothetical protein